MSKEGSQWLCKFLFSWKYLALGKAQYTLIHTLNGYSRAYWETSFPHVCSSVNARKVGEKEKGNPKVVQESGPNKKLRLTRKRRQAQGGNKSFCSKAFANSQKKMLTSSTWERFPAALRALLRVKTAVRSPTWRPKGHVPALCGFVTATATELLATFQINLHMRYQGVKERITGQESGDLVLVQVPQMTSYDLEQVTTLLWASISLSEKQVWHWIKGTEKKSLTFGAGYLPCFGDSLGIWNTLTHLVNSVQEYEWSILSETTLLSSWRVGSGQ